ncbi:hypothetical protein DMH03_10175 [Amycolatopsis sp. WAC 01376]|uniref:LppU/SCO3897 family protein n=1 Tax=Amycolatopsis sp. WAC 01376 TaxID=2203195 RepID=UPI000F777F3F|nr:hypothetical protein [Amycolatopsis sp. WAC 01376]RSM62455.1 hypothetical protein DMH03_10175 [Amycolatopsis sp. WAC 01376]
MENYPAPAVEQMVPQKKTWIIPVVILGAIGLIVLAFVLARGPRAEPVTAPSVEVGTCLKGDINNAVGVKNAECGTPEANFEVVGKQDGRSEIEVRVTGGMYCDEYSDVDAYLFQGKQASTEGVLLCLEDLKNPGQRAPVVGDCLPGDAVEAKKLAKVDCAVAGYKVLAVEKKSAVAYGDDTCAQVPSTDAKLTWRRVGPGLSQERVLCLDKLK